MALSSHVSGHFFREVGLGALWSSLAGDSVNTGRTHRAIWQYVMLLL